jgi:succinate dehydrogenase / fumarate reductase flavoprotein subunit/fumarate reductase flavoprotein subunit
MLDRAGAVMRDMEMLQFHPTGLIVPGSVVAGSLLEEGLRGAGAYLLNGAGERYMQRYAPDVAERATRDVVSRSAFLEMMAGRGCAEGGVHIVTAHLGPDFVERNFPGMCKRCRQFGYDLARGAVPVSPSAHFYMGGARIDPDAHASLQRLFVAGEDAGGVHGGNRLGGNGICESCVYGRQAGKSLARFLANGNRRAPEAAPGMAAEIAQRLRQPFERTNGEGPVGLRHELRELNWDKVGVVRNGPDLEQALGTFAAMRTAVESIRVAGPRTYNMAWNTVLDLRSMLDVSIMTAASALARRESRAAHFRSDHSQQDDVSWLHTIFLTRGEDGMPVLATEPIRFSHKSLEDCQRYRK